MFLRNTVLLSLILILMVSVLWGQQSISAKLIDQDGEAVAFAAIGLTGLNIGTTSDAEGLFKLEGLKAGAYEIRFSAVGYKASQQKVELKAGEALDLGGIVLKEDILGVEEVVVTGNLKESFVSNSPVKIDVYTGKLFEKTTSPTNLMEALSLINGVQEVVACGVCFTNTISINGLPGTYAAILIDGTPAYGNLASIYGLNGIPSTIIDRVEVIKGPNSTLYGSEAVGGVINIITKNPEEQPLVALDLMATSHLEAFSNLSVSSKVGKFNTTFGLQHAYINDYDDFNEDGFGDMINLDRLSVFNKWSMDRPNNKKFTLFAKYFYEDRRNGVEAYLKDRSYRDLRGDTLVYGESIYTQRFELMGTYELQTAESFRIDYSFSAHDQDSYYGSDQYVATQYIAYANFIWNHQFGKHDLLGGMTSRYQYYDDNTIATTDTNGINQADNQFIPGIWLQDEWDVTPNKFTLLGGMRLDYFPVHGLIPSPRLSLKYKASPWWTFRLNTGTGFKLVNLFAEDHAFITGNRQVVIEEQLRPEQSYSSTLNMNYVFSLGRGQGTFDIDGFLTYFTNAIFPDYSNPNQIIYRNLNGDAQTRGLAVNLNYSFDFPLAFNVGATFLDAFERIEGDNGELVKQDLEFAPKWSGVATLNYNWRKLGLNFAYTANLTGPMKLPEVFDVDPNTGMPLEEARPTISKPFSIHNIQISKSFKKWNLELYSGVQNVLNYRQKDSPLVGFNDPNAPAGFSDAFDAAYAFSPMHGRELYLGLRWNLARLKNK